MEFGKWELRDDGCTSYYLSKDAQIYPSSNSVDSGKLHTEENVRNIYRDLTTRNFVIKSNYFSLTLNATRNGVFVSPGEAIIQGYHFYTKNSIEVKVPNNTIYDEVTGKLALNQPIIQYTLGISLAYDAANHVTGDVVNKEGNVGESEVLSGVYITWFDECQLESNYDNILVLGRAWVKAGQIVPDGTKISDEYGNVRQIYHGFEQDPFKDHRFEGKTIEVEVHGHKTTKYDTLRDNMTQINEPLYTYDSMHFPVELNRQDRTKPPSHVTDVQDYINHLPDWYISKYGDYLTGALRFNHLSIDAKHEFKKLGIIKDSIDSTCADGVFISPRTYGDLVRESTRSVELNDFDYDVGGTLMSIVPGTYKNSTDFNNGYTGIHAALLSQKNGETGLRLHYGLGSEDTLYNTTRIVHYGLNDDGISYKNIDGSQTNRSVNTSKFIIENTDDEGRKSSVNLKHGEIFIDSYSSPSTVKEITEDIFSGTQNSSGIQFFTSGKSISNNIDFRIDETEISMANHDFSNHRTATRGNTRLGLISDTLHYVLGLNNIDETKKYNDPYLGLGNLNISSNIINVDSDVKLNTIEILNTGISTDKSILPYINIRPRIYSEQYLAEEIVQIGTNKSNDYVNNNAQNDTINRIIMKRVLPNENVGSFTYFEQDYKNGNDKRVFTKIVPALWESYDEIRGIMSAGNIGCSTKLITPGNSDDVITTNDKNKYDAYSDDAEWVRFTRYRYDNPKDKVNGGSYEGKHEESAGRQWGSTYNLEFNTNVANQRANQIIWRYKGSTGNQTIDDITNTPPVILSYIHDNTSIDQGTPTKYTNIDKGTFEQWIDHNGVTHFNPTNKVRDFLLLENAGLSISGDINNPAWCGDENNTNNLGTVITHGRVYNAVYNDFAETYEKDNINDVAQVGELIALNPKTGKYVVCEGFENKLVVGVQSNSYAFLAGGNRINNTQDILDLENEYFTVGIAGKVWTRVVDDSYIKPGDLLVSSFEKGKATKSASDVRGTIIGKSLTEPKYFEEYNCKMVLMQIMLS